MATEGHGSCLIAPRRPDPPRDKWGRPDANRFILSPLLPREKGQKPPH